MPSKKTATLPGGYSIGDFIKSAVDFERDDGSKLEKNDVGKVIGIATKEPGERFLCSFENMESVNLMPHMVERFALPGGYEIGDVIESKIDFSRDDGSFIEKGNAGKVVSVATREPLQCVLCEFPNMQKVNVSVDQLIRCTKLPGEFKTGDMVQSTIDFKRDGGESFEKGDVGTVVGFATNEPSSRLRCSFPGMKTVNLALSMVKKYEIPNGLLVGDVVESKISFARDNGEAVNEGDAGKIIGVSQKEAEARVKCSFSQMGTVNFFAKDLIKCQRIPGSYDIGDKVQSLIDFDRNGQGEHLRKGEIGEVLGFATRHPSSKICCKFPKMGSVNLELTMVSRVTGVPEMTFGSRQMNPASIRYTQDSISSRFANGMSIYETLSQLRNGELSIESIPRIEVFEYNGDWYSADNRRLWVLKELGRSIMVNVVAPSDVDARKLTTKCKGIDIEIRDASTAHKPPASRKRCLDPDTLRSVLGG
eukprot:TRINITY_DN41676_c0_g1_i1.p1 TRINITY_DN41676_c0_g1~~TRINITY_DN41676_c0_g1_i1.p1  ORF type:complete len:477 (-),score=22.32 TRINITY_DN41676_c0_g1_i1:75-1505(-)